MHGATIVRETSGGTLLRLLKVAHRMRKEPF